MKKKILSLILALVCLTSISLLASCNNSPKSVNIYFTFVKVEGNKTTYTDSTIDLAGTNLEGASLLQVLESEAYKKFFEATIDKSGGEGKEFLTSIKGITANSANKEYIALYTNDANYKLDDNVLEYNTIKYYYSNKGIGELKVATNMRYYFVIENFN